MQNASYSKLPELTQRQIDRAETDVLINLSAITQRGMAKMIGCHESKLSRQDWRFFAACVCALGMASDISPISRAFQEVFKAIGNKKAPTARTAEASQITMGF